MPAYVNQAFLQNTTAGAHAAAITPAVNELLVGIAWQSDGTASSQTVSDNQSGGTYTKVAGCVQASGARTCEIFIRNNLVGSAVSHTVTQTPAGADTGGGIDVMRFSGFTSAGTSVFVQSAKQDTQTGGTTPAPTFAAAVNTNNVTVGAVVYASNSASGTVPAGWTERLDGGYTTPATGVHLVTRDSGFTGTTVTWGGTIATNWGVVIVELGNPAAEVPVPILVAARR